MSRNVVLTLTMVFMVNIMSAKDVVFVENSQVKCAIVVDKAVMAADKKVSRADKNYDAEINRRRVRESVKDLALYMKKLSGADVPIVHAKPGKEGIPIYVGAQAEKLFGKPAKNDIADQGFRVVIKPDQVGLIGFSPLAVSYAIYELLDRWGVRWYMPTEMGEVVPTQKTLKLPVMDYSYVPSTLYRNIWYAPEAFKRRNRQGGLYLAAGHAFESYITKKDREQHPEWKAVIDGKQHPVKVKWTHPGVTKTIAQRILERHEKSPQPTYSLSPMDGIGWDETDDTKYDTGDWDPVCSTVSKSDRLVHACNAIAEEVGKSNPEILFGFLAYVDYTRPPVREKVHPNLVPQIAPITYNRQHPMTWKEHPDGDLLKNLIEGWGKKVKYLSCYPYAYNLAEVSAPCPFLTKWGTDLPIFFKNKCAFWMPETMANFENAMPMLYLGMRLSWNVNQKPETIFTDLFRNFYGSAYEPMNKYWHIIDDAWINSEEYSGCGFGYLKVFTPEVLKNAENALAEAKSACKTPMEYRRVELAAESFSLIKLFIKIRWDLVNGKFQKLAEEADTWRGAALYLAKKYDAQYCFGGHRWRVTWPVAYFDCFFNKPFKESAEIYRNYNFAAKPIRNWKFQQDPSATDPTESKKKPAKRVAIGEKQGWMKPDFDDSKWKTTDVGTETWSRIGLHHYLGQLWYRTKVKLGKIPAGKQVILWIPSTDGSVKLFINGKHVPFVDKKGEKQDTVSGHCTPFTFDITKFIQPGKENQISILANRAFMNEIGTGGLQAPPMIFTKK